ncbi:hypothetical protein HMPREF1981_02931 [Bacteroides pyogenes F0041]|uniref:Uncharacterized protein n=1 Tax=Bacteroides pyogenes F0041 TaxID=1321819 RepID=U2CB54_9BACE|nr:hypothetical protein HMPREF1981_02931 [Bacteroides pyogenes F0041]
MLYNIKVVAWYGKPCKYFKRNISLCYSLAVRQFAAARYLLLYDALV